ncbi:MAG: ral L-amino acid transport system substrate-binding protein [Rhodospirillaceae bacterium]|jgi:general L-amino acid transport system substrate-binding protein|nr:ral L-amino acid transport system substrate-binding protein [Rhodospirillaceae bacterium]
MKIIKFLAIGAVIAFAGTAGTAQSGTLQDVQKRGQLVCGVNGPTGLTGFGIPDDKGNWRGLDVDMCRAVAATVFGDATKVKFVPLGSKERFTALQSGEIDVLARNSTWTFSREADLGLIFVAVNYYDGQGFLVRKELAVDSALKLSGATICVQTGTTTEKNLADYFRTHNLELKSVVFENAEQARQAYDAGRCDAYTTDASGLASERTQLKNPSDNIILPEIISKEPLGPVVRKGDDNWATVVRWSFYAMLIAEEKGVTQANVDQIKGSSDDPEVKRMLGGEDDMGKMMGVSKDWAYNVVKQVGNYGESFERNVGLKTPLGLARGLNELWNKGGLQYAPPLR